MISSASRRSRQMTMRMAPDETTRTSGTDYVLVAQCCAGWLPLTPRSIRASPCPRNFPKDVYLGTKVVGVFGFPSVPSAVVQAEIIQAGAVWNSRTAPFGVIGSADLGGILRMSRALHPERPR